jgi:peptidyl-prolyl cis-trans isomerase B (cyclophilin B)
MYKFLLPLFALALLVGCTPAADINPDTNTTTDGYSTSSTAMANDPVVPASASSVTPTDTMPSDPNAMLKGKHVVVLKTSKGNITLELDADKAPKTVTNFVKLAQKGYYDGLIFHRVIPSFMIQGGDPSGNGTGGESFWGGEFEDEANDLLMNQGVIAMANRGPNTNGSQFFIVTADTGTPWLQGRHTIFGKVTGGMDVALAISNVERDGSDKPVTPVTFTPEINK